MAGNKTVTCLPVKGIGVPRILIWLKGFLHKVLRTGTVDKDTGTLCSGYIFGQIHSFNQACVTRREEAEARLASFWSKADELLIDFKALNATPVAEENVRNKVPQEEIYAGSLARKREADQKKRHELLKAMAELENIIYSEYIMAQDQMQATNHKLLSTFCCYGHGLTLQPVSSTMLPKVSFTEYAEEILNNHEGTWKAVVSTLEEVKKHEHLQEEKDRQL